MHTKQQEQYRRGNPVEHCGICQFYRGQGKCAAVSGQISPFGVCNMLALLKNPFGSRLTEGEKQAIRDMSADNP